jgi:hypothetical protein
MIARLLLAFYALCFLGAIWMFAIAASKVLV